VRAFNWPAAVTVLSVQIILAILTIKNRHKKQKHTKKKKTTTLILKNYYKLAKWYTCQWHEKKCPK